MMAFLKTFKRVKQIKGRWSPARFINVLLVLSGMLGATLIILTESWDWAGPVIILSFIGSLALSELVSDLSGPTFKRIGSWLQLANVPLFILFGCTLIYKVIGILTMPES